MHVKTITWSKDANQLVDYNDSHLYTSSFEISSNCIIVRVGNEIAAVKEEKLQEGFQLLCSIKCTQVDYYYLPIKIQKESIYDELMTGDSSWFVLRNNKLSDNNQSTRYLVTEGDMLKLGRIWLKIKKIKHESNHINTSYSNNDIYQSRLTDAREGNIKSSPKKAKSEDKDNDKNKPKKKENAQKDQPKPVCRICYGEEANDDPLIQPCVCSGTMKYIHVSCIKQWLTSKVCLKSSINTDCVAYLVSKIECELCKTSFPDYVRHNGELFELLDFGQSFDNYIVFEKISLDSNGNRFLYFVNFNENSQINIGRGHEANLILEEISVSRIHCIISKVQKSFYIEDNASKFGTLILIQAPQLKVIQGLPLNVQIGRTNLQMTIKEPFRFFTCCGVTEYNNNSYDRENMKHIDANRFKVTREEEADSEDGNEENEKKIMKDEQGDNSAGLLLNPDVNNKDEIEQNYQLKLNSITKHKATGVNQDYVTIGDNNENIENNENNNIQINKAKDGNMK